MTPLVSYILLVLRDGEEAESVGKSPPNTTVDGPVPKAQRPRKEKKRTADFC